MLLRTELLKSLGGFDDRYFLNWEDVDLSLRLRSVNGHLGIVPAARIYHKVGKSFQGVSEQGLYYHVRNNLLFLRVHAGEHYRKASALVVTKQFRSCFRGLRHRDQKQ